MKQKKFDNMLSVEIRPYEAPMHGSCVDLLADAFASNPMHERAFGDEILSRNHSFFSLGLKSFRGQRLVAVNDDQIVGFVHWVHSCSCQFSVLDKVLVFPEMLWNLGVSSTVKVGRWLNAWKRRDPFTEHLHLGPIGVAPETQGFGVGAALMERFCAEADKLNLEAYLETDKPENLAFYSRFNFVVARQEVVLGVTNYFMTREPEMK